MENVSVHSTDLTLCPYLLRLPCSSLCPLWLNGRMPKRKIIVTIAVSADGFIARKDGGVDWLDRPRPKGEDYGMGEFFRSIDTIIYGRKTYDMAVKFVAEGVEIPDDGRKIQNYVFSRRRPPKKVLPGFEFVKEPVKEFAQRLRTQKGKNIWMMGGG